ncbi:ScyD/ScyE family protein [Microlunatus capsulatus]|uniref:ScyD/ScyE family protein n=1 Tax=Microlunatus capsulatus TaxID=99117 RepID=A0ABS4ZDF5_9ACTN|nr:ScyD/ScyE family protein [Microlunatus capsulatus]MBP2419059.1 hypothetical protein [Microlunatus capsulatus]
MDLRPGRRAAAASLSLLTGLGALGLAPAADARDHGHGSSGGLEVVATGLDNPRHLDISGGALYVAEAGVGGAGPCFAGAEGDTCYGATGAITRVRHGRQTRVVTGLPSAADPGTGGGAVGPSDLVVRGHRYTVALGLGADPGERAGQPRGIRLLGTVATGRLGSAGLRVVADVGGYEARVNPDGTDLDTNPVALLPRGGRTYVVDAGGNALLRLGRHGGIRTTAVFPSVVTPVPGGVVDMDAVPTAVAQGPDGALYVSQLTGFPFPVGAASIWRVVPGQAPTRYATGLTNVTDLAFDRDGSLYVVQVTDQGLAAEAPPLGSVVRVPRGGGAAHTTVRGGLLLPYGIALHHGSAYVTTGSALADAGQVVRIPLR